MARAEDIEKIGIVVARKQKAKRYKKDIFENELMAVIRHTSEAVNDRKIRIKRRSNLSAI